MIRVGYRDAAFIDTSAVLALHDPKERHHEDARRLYTGVSIAAWMVLDITSHEVYTRVRYNATLEAALEQYRFLRSNALVSVLGFEASDEFAAIDILQRYGDHSISFHDALCAAAMKRLGVVKVFSFDRHFAILGFELLPGSFA